MEMSGYEFSGVARFVGVPLVVPARTLKKRLERVRLIRRC